MNTDTPKARHKEEPMKGVTTAPQEQNGNSFLTEQPYEKTKLKNTKPDNQEFYI